MNTKGFRFLLRLSLVPVSAMFALILFTQVGDFLNNILYDLTEDSYHFYLKYDLRASVIQWIFIAWLAVYLILETASFFQKNMRFNRLLTHFRYAPFAIIFFSCVNVFVFDLAMIEYSKWEIRNYVFSKSETIVEPDFRLHNNYRHWCGNGAVAQENYLYFETAAEGSNDENPYIRSRSLLMAADVQNFLNGGDERFRRLLAKSCSDSSLIVRDVAEQYVVKSGRTCQQYLLSR
jgi:hypothetical protein